MTIKIEIKRVYDKPEPTDGLRVLVDRIWPRGLKKDDAALDYWAKDLAPSPNLRKWFNHRPERFEEFGRRYESELKRNPAVDAARDYIGDGRVSLLYASRDTEHNHALVLASHLQKNLALGTDKTKKKSR